MVVEASISGIVRTILIIIGILVVLRFIGQLLIAKRNLEEERRLSSRQRDAERERANKLRNFGKVNILTGQKKRSASSSGHEDAEDVDFEEMK